MNRGDGLYNLAQLMVFKCKLSNSSSISRRFSYAFVGIITLILLGFALVTIMVNTKRINKRLEHHLNSTLRLAGATLASPMWNFDFDMINGSADALFLDPSSVYVRVVGEKEVIATRIREEFQDYNFDMFQNSGRFLAKSSEIMKEGKAIGRIEIALSRERVHQEFMKNLLGIISLIVLIIIVIAVTSIMVTHRYISIPLTKLQHSANIISHGIWTLSSMRRVMMKSGAWPRTWWS